MRYFTSDMHFGHRNIMEYCPGRSVLGSTVDEMNAELIRRWNEVIRPADEILIVGDAVMGKRTETMPFLEQLNGQKSLVLGNHDKPFDKKGDARQRAIADFNDVGVHVYDVMWFETFLRNGFPVRVCHFPYYGDSHDEDRYVENRPPDDGLTLLHGHVHDAWIYDVAVFTLQINVGVDVWDFRPVSEDQIIELIRSIGAPE